ncbi:enteropeptidase-like [Saccostrea echinata]|uniref:enteropeptidase-like n=1 Tax=Saccostrea echinata TaxID=191078 RepID=UPI002A83AA27|nr:enteropeptidase-like [Saccostrea echinata]
MPNSQNATMDQEMVRNATLESLSMVNANLFLNITESEVHTREMGVTSYSCSFEMPDEDCFLQNANNSNPWTRGSNSTPSAYTGPASAYSGEYYMFTPASNSSCVLESRLLYQNTTKCLRFYYHMYGSGVGDLMVNKFYEHYGGVELVFWRRFGNQGNMWHLAEIQMYSDALPFKLRLKGSSGSNGTSNIAVDYINYDEGPCYGTTTVPTTRQPTTTTMTPTTTMPGMCGGIFVGQIYGEIKSPNYPYDYPNSASCEWNITVPMGFVVKIRVMDFNTESGYDYVYIRDKISGTLIAR